MNIKIIEPYALNRRYDARSLTPNIGPVVIASLLERAGHEVELISEYVTDFKIEQAKEADLVGISIATYNARRGFDIAQKIDGPVVFGGFHASLQPEECLNYADYVIRGDGYSIVDLAEYLSSENETELDRIPNLVFKKDERVVYNKRESRTINIVPNYNLIRGYFKFGFKRLVRIPLLVNASRGCRHECTFCSIKQVYPEFVQKDVQVVLEDIKTQISQRRFLDRLFPKIIWITDDNFVSDKKWAKKLLQSIADLETGYCYTIQARVDIARDNELLNLMKAANVNRVYLGIESLSPKSLDGFNKQSSLEVINRAIDKIKRYGIDVHGLFVFGDDEFQKGDGRRTAKFAKQRGLSGVLIQPLTPYPGCAMHKAFEEKNRILHRNWEEYNGKVVFKPENMTAAELQMEICKCYHSVFSPWRTIRFLFRGNRGWKLELLGESIFRFIENLRIKRYIKEKLLIYCEK